MKKPNLIFFGIDSLRRDHMSLYGYDRLTTPNIEKYLSKDALVFENCFSPSVPTTPGYASMLTGKDCFSTNIVALRHKGDFAPGNQTLAEILRQEGYNTTCIGFTGNPASRGFDKYLNYDGWGAGADGKAHKAEGMNAVAVPELERLAAEDKPFLLFMRHMDPHSPYLPPKPFERQFYQRDEFDPNNKSLEPVYNFKPFCDYFVSWFPEGCTDQEYICAQYDSAIAYMDLCIQNMLQKIEDMGLAENSIVVFTSDHGETLYEHECWFDHHSTYDHNLVVPFAVKYPGSTPTMRIKDFCQLKDVMPTLLSLMGIDTDIDFDGRNLCSIVNGEGVRQEPEMYITECTWMRKHGWRTPQWKLIRALEPDFHFKAEVELYNLIDDPKELNNLAETNPETVAYLTERMEAHIAKRKAKVGRENPMLTNLDWHGLGTGPFKTSEEAYNSMHIGDANAAKKLQEKNAK
ncbi:MAG: sulfatase [Eubacteriales bacterium]